ncbi:GIY-YIG nuclease family protein [Dactylosporangium matsuzakiense]
MDSGHRGRAAGKNGRHRHRSEHVPQPTGDRARRARGRRRSAASLTSRTEAGDIRYRTTWTDRVVLTAEDELRLTAWMSANLRLTWAEDAAAASIEAELVRRLHPPLNVHGVDSEHIQAAVVAAKNAYNTSSHPDDPAPLP